MGLWNAHRQRQAGKYAKRAYRLERRRLRAPQRVQVIVRTVAAVPPRPDTRG